MADYLGWTNGVMHWDVFNRSVQDLGSGDSSFFYGSSLFLEDCEG